MNRKSIQGRRYHGDNTQNEMKHLKRYLNTTGKGEICATQKLVDKGGAPKKAAFFEKIRPSPGLLVAIADQGPHPALTIDLEIDCAPVVLSYNLNQRMRGTLGGGKYGKTEVRRSPGDVVLSYLPHTRGTLHMAPARRMAGVSIHMTRPRFIELFQEDFSSLQTLGVLLSNDGASHGFYQNARCSGESLFVVRQILNCPYTGPVRRLFMEAKSLELVALKLAEAAHPALAPGRDLGPRDLERVREARHILLAKIDDPPGLEGLGRRVGMNRNKLNRGFKQLYGKTAFALLRDTRLSRGRTLLQQSELSLSDIAAAVGYSNQANFSTAFRRQFGQSPKSVRREPFGHRKTRKSAM